MQTKQIRIIVIVLICILSIISKLVYFGWKYQDVGSNANYEVVAYKTMHYLDPRALFINDADGGYYRVYDKKGDKLFEVFSKEFAFDVVITGEQQLEIQFSRGDTLIWRPNHYGPEAEQAAPSNH